MRLQWVNDTHIASHLHRHELNICQIVSIIFTPSRGVAPVMVTIRGHVVSHPARGGRRVFISSEINTLLSARDNKDNEAEQ